MFPVRIFVAVNKLTTGAKFVTCTLYFNNDVWDSHIVLVLNYLKKCFQYFCMMRNYYHTIMST